MSEILVKWDNICNDEAWISSVLAWYEYRSSSVLIESVQQRPKIGEFITLTTAAAAAPGHDLILCNKEGDVFAKYRASAKLEPGSLDARMERQIKLRYSDRHVLRTTPLMFYFQLMSNSVDEERPITKRAHIAIQNKLDVDEMENIKLTVAFSMLDSTTRYFQVFNRDVLLCIGRLETETGPVQTRYEMARLIPSSQESARKALENRDSFGEPIYEIAPFFAFEMTNTNKGNGWLHLADIVLNQVFEHAFPPGSDFFTAKQPNGSRQYSCMWRGAAAQIFDDASVAHNSQLKCLVWIDRTGGSTLDVRADFFTMDTTAAAAASLVASVRFTIIVVNIATMKSRPVFYDRAWAEKRYSYGKQSLTSPESFALRVNPESWASIKPYSYALELRHSDHDLNGHVNSGRYMTLVEDARFAAIRAGNAGPQHVIGANWMKNFWIEYNEELHMSSAHCAYIEVKFQGVFTRFEFLYGGATCKLCAIVTVESPTQSLLSKY